MTDKKTKGKAGKKAVEYTVDKLKTEALKIIEENGCVFFEDIFAYSFFSQRTFFLKKLNVDQDILDAITRNRTKVKIHQRKKWYQSQNTLLQIALYKLICTDEEYFRLANAKQAIDYTSGGEKIEAIDVTIRRG